MSLLSAIELLELVDQGVIQNVERSSINAASIDLHLAEDFLIEATRKSSSYRGVNIHIVDLSKRERPSMISVKNEVTLFPGMFCLGSTIEIFHLPNNISGQFLLKSTIGRAGLDHAMSGWSDASWHGSSLTLEMKNSLQEHALLLRAGMAIGQMIFFKHTEVPHEFLYSTKGRYNNDLIVQQAKD